RGSSFQSRCCTPPRASGPPLTHSSSVARNWTCHDRCARVTRNSAKLSRPTPFHRRTARKLSLVVTHPPRALAPGRIARPFAREKKGRCNLRRTEAISAPVRRVLWSPSHAIRDLPSGRDDARHVRVMLAGRGARVALG